MLKIGSKRLKVKLDMGERSVWNDSPSDVAVADLHNPLLEGVGKNQFLR